MLSILIPTYNFDCSVFVQALSNQAEALHVPYEIIVCDDGSTDETSKIGNRTVNACPNCRFIELPENRGLAHNRNYLASQALYEYFLFLDSDLMPCDSHFIERYINAAQPHSVIGGTIKFRVPGKTGAEEKANLRYVYALAREEHSAAERNRNPYAHFSGFSCLIPRSVFERIHFHEELTSYGHEDTLYGKDLQAKGIAMRYIDNPVFHDIFDSSETFLEKTETGLLNACRYPNLMKGHVRILDIQQRCKRAGLQPLIRFLFAIFEKPLRRNLLGKRPKLRAFDLYKLGYICRLDHRMKQAR